MPRFSREARSLSQLSTIIEAPAKEKPEMARSRIQASGVNISRLSRMVTAATEASAP